MSTFAKAEGTIMAVGAHPGDVELMCGATLIKMQSNGARCIVVHLTDGSGGDRSQRREAYASQKKAEAKAFALNNSLETEVMDFEDGNLLSDTIVNNRLAEIIRTTKPRAIITHWENSFHPDHRATHSIVHRSSLLAAIPNECGDTHLVDSIYYAENWEDIHDFKPNFYIDVSEVRSQWLSALNELAIARGETSNFRYLQYYDALSRLRGAEVGCEAAEAFMVGLYQIPRRLEGLPKDVYTYIY
jgi:LmbE family N-acetylglucosaminyl deacetylase